MVTIIFIILIVSAVKAGKSIARVKPKAKRKAVQPYNSNFPALKALYAQKEIILDRLDEINYTLDNAPPEKQRKQLLNEKARIYGQIAAIETKINKL